MNTEGKLILKVLTPEGMVFTKMGLDAVNIPLADGSPIGIRPGHAPLIAETIKGAVRYRSINQEDEIHLHAGVLEIREDVIMLLTAGEIQNTPEVLGEPVIIEYYRLMKTLIQQIQTEDQSEQEI
jgi:F0F1-type ATP synthase epsilon subunit